MTIELKNKKYPSDIASHVFKFLLFFSLYLKVFDQAFEFGKEI